MLRFSCASRLRRAFFVGVLGCGILCGGCDDGKPSVPGHLVSIDVARDGKYLLFSGYGHGVSDLFTLDSVSGKVTQITDTASQELYPQFSPDGKRIVFTRYTEMFRPDGYLNAHELFVMDLATKKETQITYGPKPNDPPKRYDYSPSFSSDGRFVVFQGSWPRNGSPNIYVGDLFRVDLTDKHIDRLTHDEQNGMIRPAYWQNDMEIAYDMTQNAKWDEGDYIMSLPLAGAERAPQPPANLLTPKKANYYSARPMEDGRLVIISDPGKKYIWKLTIREANGSFTYLDSSINGLMSPSYDAAHRRIFYLEGMNNIYCYDLKTKTKKKIAGDAFFDDPLTKKIDQLP